jgi:hypothetical protein
MTKILLAACSLGLVVAGLGVAYPELFGLREPKSKPTASVLTSTDPAPPAKTAADKGCCGGDENGCACAAKAQAKEKTCGCCGGPPRLAHVSISVNAVTLMASPQGQGSLLAPSVWMALRRVDVTPN